MRLPEDETLIQGRKGGGAKQHTPVEDPDDLLSTAKLKMLLAIAEGEIQGELTAQNIFLNDTPLANADGSYNFTGVKWDFRPGTQDQDYIQGLPEVDNEMSANVTVTTTAPWTRQFSNLMLDAVRIKLSLPVQYTYKDNGDMVGTVTEYAVDLSTDGAAWQTVVNGKFDGKTTTEYQRDIRIDLPAATTGWAVRVRRITPDSVGNSKLINAFKVFSFAEVIDSKLRYPNTALLYIEVDASQFTSGAPKVTCRPKGKLVHVPDSYDPVTRTYSGTWSGGFKMAYTNNPAWVFYDLVLDEIYGMGIQLGIDGTGASNFLISADTFAVYNPTTNGQELVFASTGGQMFMRSVFIQDGSIDNGKIGNYIQSSNWDGTGNVGWHINKSGYATFNGVTVRGTIYATDGIFKGRVEATSGSFKGSVEATSFVGDVANTGVYPDASARSDSAVSTSIPMVYMDSSNSVLSKNAIVDALIYVRGLVGAVVATVQVTIAGNVRTFTYDVPVGGVWFSAKHAVTGLGGQRIEASIVLSSGNATMRITAATMTVTRGTGSFS